MKITALSSLYRMRVGEWPRLPMNEAFWARDPFDDTRFADVSDNLMIPDYGNIHGHNVMTDTTLLDAMRVDQEVPVSPLFARDLCGRVVYLGFGPEEKDNFEWIAYMPPLGEDGKVAPEDFNPMAPLVVFPRYCHDALGMEGHELLENVFLTKFRCLEMSLGYNGLPSGGDEEDLVAVSYLGANLYPYKLRVDSFYTDGFRLPQTQMVFALREGINPAAARKVGDDMLEAWQAREPGQSYEDWLVEMGGEDRVGRWYRHGCTLIPTFEACNGYCVVGRNFEIEDYWPGRAVLGLHEIVERRPHKAPEGTILQVVTPGYVTATVIRQARVIVSDGSGYVSPNAVDPLPRVPNMSLPHPRSLADWRTLWLPTHPEHFEAPAIWGWDLTTGRFLQLMGPLWDPLHYVYESTDMILGAFESFRPSEANRFFVPVPDAMHDRFYPLVPLKGFDVTSVPEQQRRVQEGCLIRSSLKRVATDTLTAGAVYHPMPAEFEFELDPFWFPELHPLNRDQGFCPEELLPRIVPVLLPTVTVGDYVAAVEAPDTLPWLRDEERLFTPQNDVFANYPDLARYLVTDTPVDDIMKISPIPFLSDPGEVLLKPPADWWKDDDGAQLDTPAALEELALGIYDSVWDARQNGVELVRFRHALYRNNMPLYVLGWWYGAYVPLLQTMLVDWLGLADQGEAPAGEAGAEEARQAEAAARMRAARGPVAEQTVMPEDMN